MKGDFTMFRFVRVSVFGLATCLLSGSAFAADSGQRTFAQITVEPAVDSSTGNTIYVLTPEKAQVPAKPNDATVAPLFLTLYPLSSSVSADDFNCLPTNCDHVNVLPFHFAGYDPLPGTNKACVDFNGGQECALVKGHDHLVSIASTGGDPNRTCHVQLVVFTSKAFSDGAINNRIKTESQVQALLANNDVMIVDTPIMLHCSIASEQTYDRATPVVIQFP